MLLFEWSTFSSTCNHVLELPILERTTVSFQRATLDLLKVEVENNFCSSTWDQVLKHLALEKYLCIFQENDFQLLEVEVEGNV